MRREERLRHRKDFASVYQKGAAHGNRLLMVRVRSNGAAATRFGFVASKVVGGAVVRNRLKRRLRALVTSMAPIGGMDVVVGARKPAADATYDELRRSFLGLMQRAGALQSAPRKDES